MAMKQYKFSDQMELAAGILIVCITIVVIVILSV